MTILQAITWIDDHKPNTYSQEDKIKWLSQLDMDIYNNIIAKCEGAPAGFAGYDADTDVNTTMLADEQHSQVYLHWLESQIDYWNGDTGRFNNSNALFQADLNEFGNYYHRVRMPRGEIIRYW